MEFKLCALFGMLFCFCPEAFCDRKIYNSLILSSGFQTKKKKYVGILHDFMEGNINQYGNDKAF